MELSNLAPLLPGPLRSDVEGNGDTSLQTANADFETFLTLLTAQLRNQDPLSPLDSTEFIAQLASFSGVEQQIATNERLDNLLSQSLGGDIASFAGWIGREVSVKDGAFRATGGEVRFKVPESTNAGAIRATVIDEGGVELARLNVSTDASGFASWDGRDATGIPVVGPTLRISLSYIEGGTVVREELAEVPRPVIGLRGTQDGILLDLEDGGAVGPEDVVRVSTEAT